MIEAFALPVPPSTNRLWRQGKGRVYRSDKYDSWSKDAGKRLMAQRVRPIKGRVSIEIALSEKARIDLDNSAKATIDALVKFGVIEGDSKKHVRSIQLRWEPTIDCVNITVSSCL